MPITFEPAAPMAAAASIYEQAAANARRQQQASQGQYGGGGNVRGSAVPYDTGIQDAIAFRDTFQARNEQQGMDREAAFNLQNARYQNEAQLQTMQLTQQETMRLARIRNAVGDVSADPSLSDEEKHALILQLKTGENPLAHREAMARIKNQEMINEAKAKELTFQAAHHKMTLDALGKSPADRVGFVPDSQQLSAIAEDIAANADLPPMTPQARDEFISKLATQEALRQGLGTHVLTHADGKETIISGPGSKSHDSAGTGGGTGGGKGKGSSTHPTGLSPEEYLKLHSEAMKEAESEQKMTTEGDIPGTKRLVNPPDVTWKNTRAQEIFDAKIAKLKEYNDQATPKTAGGYDASKAAWNKGKVAAAATPVKPATGVPAAAAIPIGHLDAEFDKIARSDLAPDEKMAGASILKRSRELLAKYPTPAEQAKHPEVLAELNGLADNYDALRKKMKPAGMSGGAIQKPAANRIGGNQSSTTQSIPADSRGGEAALPAGMKWVRQPDGSLKAESDESVLDRIQNTPKPSEVIRQGVDWWSRNIENR